MLIYPDNLESGVSDYPHYVTFTAITKGKPNALDTVALYLPADALKSSYTQTYGDADLGAIGVAMDKAPGASAEAMQNKLEQLGRNVGGGNVLGAVATIAGLATGSGDLMSGMNLGGAIAQATVNEAIKGATGKGGTVVAALQKKAGRIMNPHKAIIYNGPGGFRIFSFNYTMTPENEKEAKAIADIVHFFKWHMHPGTPGEHTVLTGEFNDVSKQVKNDINTSMSLTYPEEFQIKMHVNRKAMEELKNNSPQASSTNPLFRIKNCFMTDLSVDYATSGAPAFITKDAKSVPATTTMAMSFKETVLMTKNSIAKGF